MKIVKEMFILKPFFDILMFILINKGKSLVINNSLLYAQSWITGGNFSFRTLIINIFSLKSLGSFGITKMHF